MFQDPFFWGLVFVSIILGWFYNHVRHMVKPLYESIVAFQLENASQARTIEWQRRVIMKLEKKVEQVPGDILVEGQNQ